MMTATLDYPFPVTRPSRSSASSGFDFFIPEQTNSRLELDAALPTFDVNVFLAERQLSEFAELKEDWDGEGAYPIHRRTIDNSKIIIESLYRSLQHADISPNNNGTISFEWSSKSGRSHLEIGKDEYSFYLKPKIGNTIYAQGKTSEWSDEFFYKIDKMLVERLFPSPQAHSVSDIVFSAVNAATASSAAIASGIAAGPGIAIASGIAASSGVAAMYRTGFYAAAKSAASITAFVY